MRILNIKKLKKYNIHSYYYLNTFHINMSTESKHTPKILLTIQTDTKVNYDTSFVTNNPQIYVVEHNDHILVHNLTHNHGFDVLNKGTRELS